MSRAWDVTGILALLVAPNRVARGPHPHVKCNEAGVASAQPLVFQKIYFCRQSLWNIPAQLALYPQPRCSTRTCPCLQDSSDTRLPTVGHRMQVFDAEREKRGYPHRGPASIYYDYS